MSIPFLSLAESNHQQPEDSARLLIKSRLRTTGNSLRLAEVVILSGRAPQPEMARQVLRMFNAPPNPVPETASSEAKTEDTEPAIKLDDKEAAMNPIMLQAIVDNLAKTTEEGNHDFEETAR